MSTLAVLSYDTILQRYPRLVERLIIGCCLSRGEAASCIQSRQLGSTCSSDAVNHGGGVLICLRHAIRVRGLARRRVVRALVSTPGKAVA